MKLKDYVTEDVVVLAVSGKILEPPDAALFQDKATEYLKAGKKQFVADLSRVEIANSQGLRMLVGSYISIQRAGGKLVLASIDAMKDLILLTRLELLFEIYDSLEAALQSYAPAAQPRR